MRNGKKNYKLASKYDGDFGRVIVQYPNGEFYLVLEVRFPHDGQLNDNFESMKVFEKEYDRRLRKSI
jgi:hypothetical protein